MSKENHNLEKNTDEILITKTVEDFYPQFFETEVQSPKPETYSIDPNVLSKWTPNMMEKMIEDLQGQVSWLKKEVESLRNMDKTIW